MSGNGTNGWASGPQPAIDREALTRFAQALVRAQSVNDPASGRSEVSAATVVAEQMRAFGWEPRLEQVEPARPNVIAVLNGVRPGPTLLFEGHTDVVTEGPREEWTVEPFGGEIRDGRLYGRGSADMKAGVAAMLFAADAVKRLGAFPGRIVVAALADEEGMMLGAKHFAAGELARGVDAAIICEPEGGEVCTAQKGALRLRLDVAGKMAHGAMPHQGINPAPALAAFIALVGRYEQELQARSGSHPLLGLPYLTPTVIQAGEERQLNVIPARAWLALDVRTTPAVGHGEIVERLRESAREVAAGTAAELTLSVVEDRPWTEVSENEPVVRAVVEAHATITGDQPVIGGVPGATDGTILHRELGIPVVVYGPGDKWIAHQADEFVELDELERYARVYATAALRFLHGGPA